MERKKKQKTIRAKVLQYLQKKKIATKKTTIAKELKLSIHAVNRACRVLRKKKRIGMYYRKYWGIP